MKVKSSRDIYALLNGLFCIHKPKDTHLGRLCEVIKAKLCKELNTFADFTPGLSIELESSSTDNVPLVAAHPNVTGGAFDCQDVVLIPLQHMDYQTAGICPLLVNCNDAFARKIRSQTSYFTKSYLLDALLGRATLDWSAHGRIVEKSSYHHVTVSKLNRVLAKLQSVFQKQAFQYAGLDMKSQRAYDLASKGLVRPIEDSPAVFYAMKCVRFCRPAFRLEVQCINESDWFLKNFIHELGLTLRTGAVYTDIRKIRHGVFLLEHALLPKHWSLEHVLNNITMCNLLMKTTEQQASMAHLVALPDSSQRIELYKDFYPTQMELIPDYTIDDVNTELNSVDCTQFF